MSEVCIEQVAFHLSFGNDDTFHRQRALHTEAEGPPHRRN